MGAYSDKMTSKLSCGLVYFQLIEKLFEE